MARTRVTAGVAPEWNGESSRRSALSRYHSDPPCSPKAFSWEIGPWCPTAPRGFVVAEERVKPRSMFVEEAIQQALESRWSDALAVNQALMERHGPDEDTYNRIGKALTELRRLPEAMEAYSAALRLNPLNLIAQKNVRKLSAMVEAKEHVAGAKHAIDP